MNRRAVETEFSHLQLSVFDGQGVGVRFLGYRRMKGRIEDCDVRYAGELREH